MLRAIAAGLFSHPQAFHHSQRPIGRKGIALHRFGGARPSMDGVLRPMFTVTVASYGSSPTTRKANQRPSPASSARRLTSSSAATSSEGPVPLERLAARLDRDGAQHGGGLSADQRRQKERIATVGPPGDTKPASGAAGCEKSSLPSRPVRRQWRGRPGRDFHRVLGRHRRSG